MNISFESFHSNAKQNAGNNKVAGKTTSKLYERVGLNK